MDGMAKIPMPVDLPIWGLATLRMTRPQLRALLGMPHFVETDPRRTCGGEEDGWAYALPTGQRMLIILDATIGCAGIFGDPPDLGPLLLALGIAADDPRLVPHAEPLAMK